MAEGGWDYDPTADNENPDLDFGIDHDGDDDEDEEEVDTTRPFQSSGTSTQYHGGEQHEMHTLPREQSGLGDTVPLIGSFLHDDDKPAKLAKAKDFIKRKFPKANFGKIRPLLFGKSERNEGEIVYLGERNEKEYPVFFKNGSNLLKSFTNTFKEALGPEAKDVISEKDTAIREDRQRLREAEKQLKESEGISVERQKKSK